MANEIKYLSYDGLDYFWNQKLKPIIETHEEAVATALADFDNRLITHIHTKYAPTSHTHTYVASAGYSASAGYAAYAGYVSKPLLIQGNGSQLGRYNGSSELAINITAASIGAASSSHTHTEYAPSTHTHMYVASAGYAASAGYSASAARATYSASAGYVSRVNLQTSNSSSYLPMVFTTAKTATVGAYLYIDSVTDITSTATGIRYNPYYNTCYCSGGFYEASDERLKNFGDNIEVDLDKLSKLSKKYFTWKYDESNTQHIGVSAQEIQKLYPELVNAIDEDGHLSVSYDKLSVIALKGIDVLNDKITSLEEHVERLEKLIK